MNEKPCACPFHTIQDPNSSAVTAPDLSFTVTADEGSRALSLFELTDWDALEANLPDGDDVTGVRIDRHNRNIRMALLAESLQYVRHAEPGAGIALLENPYYVEYVEKLLDVFDQHQTEESR